MSNYDWQKSSYSGTSANCIDVAADDGTIKLRESDSPDTIVTTTPEKLRAFILGIKAGEFDHFVNDATDIAPDTASPEHPSGAQTG
ncbi:MULTISPECIES: DUF397 domain-containing protein [unclassified Streptomyces]|uniref:DUF397 domain-containing protein n=1 Tax=unclassified Streptomyces TaxID=2593676 RepID=UPI00081E59BC|nr:MULTISPECIES: DUF397 domain-containing protein [unclassified Streptomyces]MYZ35873.1 DUF397 domain-containing protein [Streptomyces sp. SID4917]SCF79002.1 protein of unknown function [Streptomyces sp. MnatMP-M17]